MSAALSSRKLTIAAVGTIVGLAFENRLPNAEEVRCAVDTQHASQLTRQNVTAAVHYITFELSPEQVAAFGARAVLAVDHPSIVRRQNSPPPQ